MLSIKERDFVKDLSKLPSDYFKNLYFDVSGTKSYAVLQCALEVTDASHILFGSDFPANQNVSQSIQMIKDSTLSDDMKSEIMENRILSKL